MLMRRAAAVLRRQVRQSNATLLGTRTQAISKVLGAEDVVGKVLATTSRTKLICSLQLNICSYQHLYPLSHLAPHYLLLYQHLLLPPQHLLRYHN
jgi:hypothetical protein